MSHFRFCSLFRVIFCNTFCSSVAIYRFICKYRDKINISHFLCNESKEKCILYYKLAHKEKLLIITKLFVVVFADKSVTTTEKQNKLQ
jgi:hypothetical protein